MKPLTIGLLFLAGCSTTAPSQDSPFAQEARTYFLCNEISARRFARQPGDVMGLAIAAEGNCLAERSSLMEKMLATRGPGYAQSQMPKARDITINGNAAAIARVRAGQ